MRCTTWSEMSSMKLLLEQLVGREVGELWPLLTCFRGLNHQTKKYVLCESKARSKHLTTEDNRSHTKQQINTTGYESDKGLSSDSKLANQTINYTINKSIITPTKPILNYKHHHHWRKRYGLRPLLTTSDKAFPAFLSSTQFQPAMAFARSWGLQ